MTKICWGYPSRFYHKDIGDGEPKCGVAFDTNEEVIGLGDTDRKPSVPIGKEECPECWPLYNPNQTDLFA